MQDRFEQQQDEYHRLQKEKRAKGKYVMDNMGKSLIYLLVGNAFAFVIYLFLLEKLVSEKVYAGDDVSGLVCTYSFIMQIVVLFIAFSIMYGKNPDEQRTILHASRTESFSRMAYYVMTWRRVAWITPVMYLIMQLPFMLYYARFGYFYEAETRFAHFYIPQLALCEWTQSAFFGVVCNVLISAVIYGIVILIAQHRWLRERIRG